MAEHVRILPPREGLKLPVIRETAPHGVSYLGSPGFLQRAAGKARGILKKRP